MRWGGTIPHLVSGLTFRNIVIEHTKQFIDMAIAPGAYTPGGFADLQVYGSNVFGVSLGTQ